MKRSELDVSQVIAHSETSRDVHNGAELLMVFFLTIYSNLFDDKDDALYERSERD